MKYYSLPYLLLLALVVVLLVTIFVGPIPSLFHRKDVLRISAREARRQRFTLILDIRSARDREEGGHYPNSISTTLQGLQDEVPFLLGQNPSEKGPRSTPILVYSHKGDGRAKQAAEALYAMGYINVRYLNDSYVDLLPPGPQSV